MARTKDLAPAGPDKRATPKREPKRAKPLAPSTPVSHGAVDKVSGPRLSPSKPHDDETRAWLARWVLMGLGSPSSAS
jgi:hypothetical protein